jgi:acetate kinase
LVAKHANKKKDAYLGFAQQNAGVISVAASRVALCVFHAGEEWMIANTVCRVSGLSIEKAYDHEYKKGV